MQLSASILKQKPDFMEIQRLSRDLAFNPLLEEQKQDEKIENDVMAFVNSFMAKTKDPQHWSNMSAEEIYRQIPEQFQREEDAFEQKEVKKQSRVFVQTASTQSSPMKTPKFQSPNRQLVPL